MVQTSPTPFDVGRAFVHQYYTLLHQAPQLLFRFYSTDSTFIHGGVDRPDAIEQPAVGPENIARRINELNLRDCHAKIRQVDSHPTIGNGVVVQVTGELSNNGDPMRRFMQTFVLAPRQPKKYYVQNDIFRYQDEVFDEGSDDDDRSSSQIYGDTDKVSNADSSVAAAQQQPLLVTNPTRPVTEEPQHQPLPPRNQQQVIPNPTVRQQEPTINGLNESTGYTEQQETIQENQQQTKQAGTTATTTTTIEGPSSYAGIAKLKSATGPAPNVPSASSNPVAPPPPQQQINPARPTSGKPTVPNRSNNQSRGNGNFYQQNNRGNQWNDNSQQDPNSARRSGGNNINAPNEQQVFVGSLPLEFTRNDLIDCFQQFGNVLDAKIHTPTYDNRKNFGFVVFDDANVASRVVKMEHVTYNNHRLNVEPKTQRNYSGNGNNGPQGNPRNYPSRNSGGGNRGGGRGSYRGNGNNPRRGGGQYPNNSSSFPTGDETYNVQQQA